MSEGDEPTALTPASTALERAQAISRAISDAARRARFSTRARSAYRGDSFQARRGSKLLRMATISLFVLLVVIPDLVVTVYYGLIASDQYVAEARLAIGSGVIPKMDGLGSITGVPPILIIQDIQVVTNYIHSRPMVEKLERAVDLRDLYSKRSIDWWSRLRRNKPIEKFTDYWKGMSSASIGMPSGIVTVTVRAFTPQDAKRIADAVVSQSEDLINALNDRMRSDTVMAAERDLEQAAKDLGRARMAMELERNAEGLIDVGQTSKALTTLVSEVETEYLKSQQEYQTQLNYVSQDAPQMRVLKSRIAALQAQLDQLRAQLTTSEDKKVSAVADEALSGKMTKFSDLELQEKIAAKRYALAVAGVETARMISERKMLYLHEIVAPALPQESKYPKRALTIGMTILASLIAWGAAVGAMAFVRNHMA